jgi:SAM-dependent methyltransferase
MQNFDVKEFRFLKTDDVCETKYEAWSRIYEYPYALNILKTLGANNESFIHNTSWGFEGCHVTFKNELDAVYNNVLHSDIKHSELTKTMIYDITQEIDPKFFNYFDFVLNISTVEEVNFPNDRVINNLFQQVKVGGYLILTFDYDKNNCNSFGNNSINLSCVENYINKKIQPCTSNILNGLNSILPHNNYGHLNCGVLVIKKL